MYYMKTKEQQAEYMRKWRAANKEKNAKYQNEYHKEYRKKNREKLDARNIQWRKENYQQDKDTMFEARLRRRYNLTLKEYNNLIAEQNNCCKVCGKHGSDNKTGKLYIDHCHTTNKVRGLLCMECNTALGLLKDDTKRIESLLSYLTFK